MHVLAARGLTKRYGSRAALRGVDLELDAGDVVGIVGPNGAGKTTLLSILAGITALDGGVLEAAPGAVGWVPQTPALYGKLSVAENLRLFARLEKVADVGAAVARMLEQTGLGERADEPVERLSGGNRQRVNIAIGLLRAPAVLLLDEPSASLDPRQRERLWEFVGALAAGGTAIVFSTHAIGEVERHAGRVLVLADGEQLFSGSPRELAGAVADRAGVGDGGAPTGDLDSALLAFLHARGH